MTVENVVVTVAPFGPHIIMSCTSLTASTINLGTHLIVVNEPYYGLEFGMRVRVVDSGDVNRWMEGEIILREDQELTIDVDLISGAGSGNSWYVNLTGSPGPQGATGPQGPPGPVAEAPYDVNSYVRHHAAWDILPAYQPLDGDLTAIAALTGTNTIYYRSGLNAWTPVTFGDKITFAAGQLQASGFQPLDGDLTALAALSATGVTGLHYRKAADTWVSLNMGSGITLDTASNTLNVIAGGGNVSTFGTPAIGQWARWKSTNTIEGVTAPPSIYYDIKNYGAVLDGTTDCLAAINAALAAAAAAGGGVVFFPAGTAVVTGRITVPADNITLLGVGSGASKIKVSPSIAAPDHLVVVSSRSNTTIQGLGFDLGNTTEPVNTVWAASTAYSVGQFVVPPTGQTGAHQLYKCLIAHTSAAAFSTDLNANRWWTSSPYAIYCISCTNTMIDSVRVQNLWTLGLAIESCSQMTISNGNISRAVATGKFTNQGINISSSISSSGFIYINNIVFLYVGMQACGDMISITNCISHGTKYGGGFTTGGPNNGNLGKYMLIGNISQYGTGIDVDGTYCCGYELQGVGNLIIGNTARQNYGIGMVCMCESSIIIGNQLAGNGVGANPDTLYRSGLTINYIQGIQGMTGTSNFIDGNYLPSDVYQVYGYNEFSMGGPSALTNNVLGSNYLTTARIISPTTSGWNWVGYTPTLSSQSGAYGVASLAAAYIRRGKTVTVRYQVAVAGMGSAGTASIISLPPNCAPVSDYQSGSARCDVTGRALISYVAGGQLYHTNYDATMPAGSYRGTFTYECT